MTSEHTEMKVQMAILEAENRAIRKEFDIERTAVRKALEALHTALNANTLALAENTKTRNLVEGGISVGNRVIILLGVIVSAAIALLNYFKGQ